MSDGAMGELAAPMQRCPQCWTRKPNESFLGSRGVPVRLCSDCRGRYSGWSMKTARERLAAHPVRRGLDPSSALRVTFTESSHNRKLGPIPCSTSSPSTCPPSCSFYGAGCYAEFSFMRARWAKVASGGIAWDEFCGRVERLAARQLWRHNEAGDLPGRGRTLDVAALLKLVDANERAGARGFTFTHKPLERAVERSAIRSANLRGFTVNLSADGLAHADALAELGIGPVAVVVPSDAPKGLRTPAGRHVVLCPAETHDLTCARCQLCASSTRKAVVGFRAHGQMREHVSTLTSIAPRTHRTRAISAR